MKTGEYLSGDRPAKAPKPAKRPPSGSKTPVTPVKGKGPTAKIEPRPMPKGGTDFVKTVAKASAAAKTDSSAYPKLPGKMPSGGKVRTTIPYAKPFGKKK